MPQRVELRPSDTWLLLGGGALLVDFIDHLQELGEPFAVAVAPRHLDEAFTFARPETNVREALTRRGVDFWEVTEITDLRVDGFLAKGNVTGLSLDAPWILPKRFIDRFEGRLFNNHGARLPRDRGGGGFSWRILRNDRLGFSLLHQLDTGIDTGGIVKTSEYIYPSDCTIPRDYFAYSHDCDLALLRELADDKQNGRSVAIREAPEYLSTYWPRLNTLRHGAIDWTWAADALQRFVNAFDHPYPGAFSFVGDKQVHFHGAQVSTDDGQFHPFQSGMIYRISHAATFIATTTGTLIVEELKDDQGAILEPKIGDRFHTPSTVLEDARIERAHYTATGLKGPKS